MAVAIARVAGADYVAANKRHRVRTLTFSGNYATGGETINATDVGLRVIEQVQLTGQVAAASTPTSGVVLSAIISSTGGSVVIRSYELGGTGAAGDPLAEKTNAEAYVTGQNVRATFIGY